MQDESLGVANRDGLLIDVPKPLWTVVGRTNPPQVLSDFKPQDFVVNAAEMCGCMLVRTKKRVRELSRVGHVHRCTVCMKAGGGNGQERWMLGKVRALVESRAEHILLCCQMPVGKKKQLRCDVVLVPCEATLVQHLIGIELDGSNHEGNPMQFRATSEDAFSDTAENDSTKEEAVLASGMRFVRLSRSDMKLSDDWQTTICSELDHVQGAILRSRM